MGEIRIEIRPEQIIKAKQEQKVFDAQKTHNKFNCNTNYIGLLGEMVFNDYLTTKNFDYTWFQYTKQGWNEPDFKINGKTIDLKTTFSEVMWIQKEKFDIYIYAQINKSQTLLKIKGWLSLEDIKDAKMKKNCKIVKRENRIDYVFEPHFMNDPLEILSATHKKLDITEL
tara:strand:- start:32 stop:541 length:510 start_codon:yes stop_codon:yes gene_type:complete